MDNTTATMDQKTRPETHRRHRDTFLVTWLVLATAALAALGLAAHNTPYFGIDLAITRAVQVYQPHWFAVLMNWVSWPGFPPQVEIWVGLIVIILFLSSRWKGVAFAFATIGTAPLQFVIKSLVQRVRPSPDLVHVADTSIGNGPLGLLSFPAGHVASYLCIFGFLWYMAYLKLKNSPWRILIHFALAVIMVGVGYSRIYEGEHWFSDVIGGYLTGSIWLIVTIYFYEWGNTRFFRPAQDPDGKARLSRRVTS